MRQITGRALWIGNAGDLRDPRALFDAGIEAVVELADSERFAEFPRNLVRCRFPLSDGGENPDWLIRLAADTVTALLHSQVPMLICCSAGMSRSLSIAAAGLSLAENRSLAESLALVTKEGPADVSPNLINQIQHVLARAPDNPSV